MRAGSAACNAVRCALSSATAVNRTFFSGAGAAAGEVVLVLVLVDGRVSPFVAPSGTVALPGSRFSVFSDPGTPSAFAFGVIPERQRRKAHQVKLIEDRMES